MVIFDNVMRVIKLFIFAIIMLAFGGVAYGQSYVNFGMKVPYAPNYYAYTNIGLRVTDSIWFDKYATSDTNHVLGFNNLGKGVFRQLRPQWDTAYNDRIVSATFTGTTNKTLTLTQQDGGTIPAGFYDRVGNPGYGLLDTFRVDSSVIATRRYLDSLTNSNIHWKTSGNTLSSVGTLGSLNSIPIRFRTNDITYDSLGAAGRRTLFTPTTTGFDFFTIRTTAGAQLFKIVHGTNDVLYRYNTDAMPVDLTVVKASGSLGWSSVSNYRINSNTLFAANSQGDVILSINAATRFIALRTGGETGTSRVRVHNSGRVAINSELDDGTNSFQVYGTQMLQNTPAGALTDSTLVKVTGGQIRAVAPIATIVSNIDTATSTSSSITLSKRGAYAFTGTTATWTLPASPSTPTYYLIKNRGSGNLTIVTTGGTNTIYETSLTNTLTVTPTGAYTLFYDGSVWNVKN